MDEFSAPEGGSIGPQLEATYARESEANVEYIHIIDCTPLDFTGVPYITDTHPAARLAHLAPSIGPSTPDATVEEWVEWAKGIELVVPFIETTLTRGQQHILKMLRFFKNYKA